MFPNVIVSLLMNITLSSAAFTVDTISFGGFQNGRDVNALYYVYIHINREPSACFVQSSVGYSRGVLDDRHGMNCHRCSSDSLQMHGMITDSSETEFIRKLREFDSYFI